MRLDQSQRIAAERLAHEKAQAFAAQYARAKAEAEINRRRSDIKILSRSDSGYETDQDLAEYRRWDSSSSSEKEQETLAWRLPHLSRLSQPRSGAAR